MKRVVVKIGSSSLTSEEGGLSKQNIQFYADELASLFNAGNQVILVTSGSIAAGFKQIGYQSRPKIVHQKQAAAAVGQALLMQAYQEAFAKYNITCAQILLTRYDFSNRTRMNNALMTIEELLSQNIIPIINENDTVSTNELDLKFGDNDHLSALVASMTKANKLCIVTDMDGLYTADPRKDPHATKIEYVEAISLDILALAGGAGSAVGTGGMRSKIEAARIAMRSGVETFIGKVAQHGDLIAATQSVGKGTYFHADERTLSMKKQWLGFHSEIRGRIVVDEGAKQALIEGHKSLLPAGVISCTGDFTPGDVVDVLNMNKQLIGRGVVNYATWQLQAAFGLSSDEVQKRLDVSRIEVIHRDEWITL